MSIHVCKCNHNGKEEFHLRYPGLTEERAQTIADMINGGALDIYYRGKRAQQDAQELECNHKFVVDAPSSISVCIHCGSPERIKKRDEWRQYLKDGETPFERFMRERKDLDALMTLYQSALQENERFKAQQEPVVRFCPGCGSVGPVDYSKHRDCCPDGGDARMIPTKLAAKCRDLFMLAIESATPTPPAQRVELTEEEISSAWRDATRETLHDSRNRFAQEVIEAYERKN